MPQPVNMIIELRGGGNHRHLHLKQGYPLKVKLTSEPPGDLQVNLKVTVESTSIPDANAIGLTAVTIWFPHASPLFIRSTTDPTPVREVTILVGQTVPLTLNPLFDRQGVGNANFVIPLAIYCTVDGGQNPATPGHGLDQRGRQMIDGHHSHPECEVGP